MDSLNQVEIQNIRHICGMASNCCAKIEYYKTLTTDQKITNVLEQVCSESTTLKNELCNLL
ncbi:hypothetical protein D3C76_1108680 [compost metagenome]